MTDDRDLTAHPRDTGEVAPGMLTCEQCGNMGYPDTWPYVELRDLVGIDEILCDDCLYDWEAEA